MFSIADGKGVIGEHLMALAVAIFNSGDHHIQGCERLFQLEPVATTASRGVRRIRDLGDDSFMTGGEGIAKCHGDIFGGAARNSLSNTQRRRNARENYIETRFSIG